MLVLLLLLLISHCSSFLSLAQAEGRRSPPLLGFSVLVAMLPLSRFAYSNHLAPSQFFLVVDNEGVFQLLAKTQCGAWALKDLNILRSHTV